MEGALSGQFILQFVETAAVVLGVIFGLIQLRQLRVQREVQAGIELLRPLQAPEWGEAVLLIHALPDNLSNDGLRKALGRHYGQVIGALSMFEALGPLVARGHVPIEMYSDFYRGVTVLCWHKMRRSIEEQRAMGWPNLFEWLHWLSERMEERLPPSGDRPAFERYSTWTKSSDFQIL